MIFILLQGKDENETNQIKQEYITKYMMKNSSTIFILFLEAIYLVIVMKYLQNTI